MMHPQVLFPSRKLKWKLQSRLQASFFDTEGYVQKEDRLLLRRWVLAFSGEFTLGVWLVSVLPARQKESPNAHTPLCE